MTNTVTMGAQVGDPTAFAATKSHIVDLRKLLDAHCLGPYSPEVDRFALVLRIDGDIDHWEQEGCDRLRRSRKGRYITIDIYIPRERWEGRTGMEIRLFLATHVEVAFRQMIAKLQKDKTAIDGEGLLRDFAVARDAYLSLDETSSRAV